jgi:hypothetical protein|tara:strand:+ start:384 stop:857 length:474 start_codon:yes stop_codon:yes gene_type:complete
MSRARDYDRPDLSEQDNAGLSPTGKTMRRFYQRFGFNIDSPMHDIEGDFCHESSSNSATRQLLEVLHNNVPETIEMRVRAKDSEEVFVVFAEMKFISLKKHYYERTDAKRQKWNAKDAEKNKKILGHDGQLTNDESNKIDPKECGLEELTAPINEFA